MALQNIGSFAGGFKKLYGGQSFGFRKVNFGFQQKKLFANQFSYKNQFRSQIKQQIFNEIGGLSDNIAFALSPGGSDPLADSLIKIKAIRDRYLRQNPDGARVLLESAQLGGTEEDKESVFQKSVRGSTVDKEA